MSNDACDFVLTTEAAQILCVSAQTIRAWERVGKLTALKTERGVRLFRRGDIQELALLRRSEKGRDGA